MPRWSSIERDLRASGARLIAGVDEVGRGPLAGPVVACAIVMPPERRAIAGVDDSKALKAKERERAQFDTIVLDPPAFAKTRPALPGALRGYKEINLRAMRLLSPGGLLFTASCSFHLSKPLFLEMLEEAAADSGRHIVLREIRGQSVDHPELLTVPETGYIKGALLEALD